MAPIRNQLVNLLQNNPYMHDENFHHDVNDGICLPFVENLLKRIVYVVKEYYPLIDSSNIDASHWLEIAEDIRV